VFLFLQAPASAPTPIVVQIDLDDVVHPVSADYIQDGWNHAQDINARAVVLRLDTPGGLIDSMRDIVEAILASPVPVITWVGPVGSRAASAFFILHPATLRHGARHEYRSGASSLARVIDRPCHGNENRQRRNCIPAKLHERRGRNAALAEKGVTESQSFTSEEALKENLIDAVIPDGPHHRTIQRQRGSVESSGDHARPSRCHD
jgi:membrane-bound serine protease (ClpP class)